MIHTFFIPVIVGFVFTFLVCMQQVNSAKGRWKFNLFINPLIGLVMYFQIRYAADKNISAYFIFQCAATIGSATGIWFGHRIK